MDSTIQLVSFIKNIPSKDSQLLVCPNRNVALVNANVFALT